MSEVTVVSISNKIQDWIVIPAEANLRGPLRFAKIVENNVLVNFGIVDFFIDTLIVQF